MGIIGDRPESGIRLVLTLEAGGASYRGEVATSAVKHPVRVVVGQGDGVEVALEGTTDEELAERVRLIVRTVIRHARADGRPLPRSVQRWRP